MYGMIHKSIKDLVTKTFGKNIWNKIAEDAAVDPEDFLSLRNYDDEIVYRLIAKSSEHLEMDTEDLLVAFGEHWVLATASEHYGQLIQSYGDCTWEVLRRINQMHSRISSTFLEYRPPMFVTEFVGQDRLVLHYTSSRTGLSAFVVGLVKGLAKLYEENIEITQTESLITSYGHSARFSLVRH